MKTANRLVVLATALAGVVAMGADPAPAPDPAKLRAEAAGTSAAIDKLLPRPQAFRIVISGDVPQDRLNGAQICVGADQFRALFAAIAENAEVSAKASKGCTHSREKRADGSIHFEMACDAAAGAMTTSRLVMDGSLDDMSQHMELDMRGFGAGAPKTVVTNRRMTRLGDCPADLKPGQFKTKDGVVIDPMAELAKLGKDMEAAKTGVKK